MESAATQPAESKPKLAAASIGAAIVAATPQQLVDAVNRLGYQASLPAKSGS